MAIRVAYINSVCGFGSTGKIVCSLAKIDNVEGKVYFGRKTNLSDVHAFKFNGFFGNSLHAIKTYLFDAQGFANKHETKKMLSDLEKFNPDIIHLHNLHGYYLNIEELFSYLKNPNTKTQVIWTMHDCWAMTGHCAHFESHQCSKWQCKCFDCPALKSYPVTWNPYNVAHNFVKKREIFNNVENLTIITPSKWLQGKVKLSFLSKYSTKTIYNGINLDVFKPIKTDFRKNNLIEDKFIILACASIWTNEKGLDDYIKLSNNLNENTILIMVGINKKQRQLFKSANVICIERTENIQELVEIYSTANLFVNFSKEDTFPTVNLEALSCGCPIICYDVGGEPEILNENIGKVIPKFHFNEAVDTISSVINGTISFDKEECVTQSRKYSVKNMLDDYENLYFSLIKRREEL